MHTAGVVKAAGGAREQYDAASLLAVAVRTFNDRGYDGTSMSDLAVAAGISKSSIYHHFTSKEQLLNLAVSRALDSLFRILEEAGAVEGPALAKVKYVVRRTVEVLISELPSVTLLLRVRGNTDTERWALEQRREFDRRVATMVDEAARAGYLRTDIDPRLATRLLFGMVNSISEWYRSDGDHDPSVIAAAATELALSGLQQPHP
jgi:AcrR family transcriptional regulator